MAGRFAPSPTSDLHVGNLRTAVLAWLFARSTRRAFVLRIEDLDQLRVAAAPHVAQRQLADLAALGLDWDGPVMVQSDRLAAYAEALATLAERLYECYCSRREIAEAARAPHADGFRPYPGTCRHLTADERVARRAVRPPALRVRADSAVSTVSDMYAGTVSGIVDDFVVVRNDGTPAYNLAVVADDIAQDVDQVVRGNDLLSSAPRQAWLARQLGATPPAYAHVPLAVNGDGVRLAKRDGSLTLRALVETGLSPAAVLGQVAVSCGLATQPDPVDLDTLLGRFDPALLPLTPWVVPDLLG